MDRELFAGRLHDAAVAARDFARRYVEEPLPDELRFRVRLNSSYDGNALVGDEVVFPDDSGYEKANELKDCSEQQVLDLLWRNKRVPEWINLSVIGESGSATLVEVLSCGRFTADEGLLYHLREGKPPFHVLGPALPLEWEDGERFSIHRRSECWTWAELDRLQAHASKVWSLELYGHELDDRALAQLPELPNMQILELKFSALKGHGAATLQRHRKLRLLRINLDVTDEFSVPKLSALPGLELTAIENLPSREWGSANLFNALPKLTDLTLSSQDVLHVEGKLPASVANLHLRAKRIEGAITPPSRLESLSLHLSEMTEAQMREWLDRVRDVRFLHLRGTPLSDAYAEALPERFNLEYLDVVDTGVTEEAVKRITSKHPKLRLHPTLNATSD
ncbi:MAG: hypothetical protein AB7T06_44795 [Kofleriaceae bacterium]